MDVGDIIEEIGEMDAKSLMCEMYDDGNITPGFDVEIGDGISRNRSLRILGVANAEINALPRLLPESLVILDLFALRMQTFPNLSNLTNLKRLKLMFVPRDGEPVEEYEMPRWIGELSKLETLLLASPQVTALPTEISRLPRLRHLYLDAPNLRDLPSLPSILLSLVLISNHLPTLPTDCSSLLPRLRSLYIQCPKLGCLPSLPSSLSSLALQDCRSCCSTGDISNLKELLTLEIRDCAISEIRGLDGLQNLGQLWLVRLPLVKIYFDLSNSNRLQQIRVARCSDLVEIQGKLPSTLSYLHLQYCGSLQKLPDLSNLKGTRVRIKSCGKLDGDKISSFYSKKVVRSVGDRDGLEGEDKSEEQIEHGSEGEDDEFESEIEHGSEGKDDESESEIEHGSEDEDDESECETDG